ncbi:MAG TPA: hypothetical protein VHO91_00545, partial [Rhodopila sp.]|nr:hypothetical protein [Rhodopila sp.]
MSVLLGNTKVMPVAVAQMALPPLPSDNPSPRVAPTEADPPEQVGRVATVSGLVSFRTQADTQWTPVSINYPVSAGNAFRTEPTASADIDIANSRLAMSGATELTITRLDEGRLQAVAGQGEVYIHLRGLGRDEAWLIATPRGVVRLRAAGRYDIAVGTVDQPTLVTVLDGAASVDGPGLSVTARDNQTAILTGSNPFQGSVGPAMRTDFLEARLA